MKKTALFLSIATLALTMAACAEDEPLSHDSTIATTTGISFRPAMAGDTRAVETTNANLNDFNVTAIWGDKVYFDQLQFSRGSDNFFTSTPEYAWPGDNSEIDFYAYSPSTDELGADVTISTGGKTMDSFSPAEDIADQVDFITAYAKGNAKENESTGVELDFKHQLSQIEVQAKSNNETYVFKVEGVRIGRPQTTASFDFSTMTWTLDDWHDTGVYTSSCDQVTLSGTPVSVMGKSGNAMLLPQTLTPWSPTDDPDNVAREAYLSVLINITTKDGVQVYPFESETKYTQAASAREYGWVSIPLSGTWEAGKKYVYTLDFSKGGGYIDPDDPNPGTPVLDGPIKFTINVENWIASPDDISMQTYKVK